MRGSRRESPDWHDDSLLGVASKLSNTHCPKLFFNQTEITIYSNNHILYHTRFFIPLFSANQIIPRSTFTPGEYFQQISSSVLEMSRLILRNPHFQERDRGEARLGSMREACRTGRSTDSSTCDPEEEAGFHRNTFKQKTCCPI